MTEFSEANRLAETVLVVDSDRRACGHVSSVLRARGYQVLSATTADAALRFAGDPERAIDLLLADMRMTGMSGPELAGRLLEQRPSMAVMYMSCQSSDVLPPSTDQTDVPFVLKPCSPQALGHSVAETLRKAAAELVLVAALAQMVVPRAALAQTAPPQPPTNVRIVNAVLSRLPDRADRHAAQLFPVATRACGQWQAVDRRVLRRVQRHVAGYDQAHTVLRLELWRLYVLLQ